MGPIDVATADGIATITMDDGKANALSPSMLCAIGAALDEVEADESVGAIVLAGRPGRFSAGFDLGVLNAGGPEAERMLLGGFELAERVLGFPKPVVTAAHHATKLRARAGALAEVRAGIDAEFRRTVSPA